MEKVWTWLPTAGWIGLPILCYYGVRPLSNPWLRGGLTTVGCVGLIASTTRDLPKTMSSVMQISLYWMCSIRMINLMTLPDEQRLGMDFLTYAKKFLWFVLPVSERAQPRPPLELAKHITYLAGLAGTKLVATHFMRNWIIKCLDDAGGGEAVARSPSLLFQYTAMYCVLIAVGTFELDIQRLLVSLFTLDRYELQPFNDFPVLSSTPREFWGRRYNKLVSGLLHESVFTPLRAQAGLAPQTAALAAFAVSGALHMHVASAGLGGSALSALLFFLLHGAACTLERRIGWDALPRPLGILLMQGFFLATAPLYVGLFVRVSPGFMRQTDLSIKLPFTLPVPSSAPRASGL